MLTYERQIINLPFRAWLTLILISLPNSRAVSSRRSSPTGVRHNYGAGVVETDINKMLGHSTESGCYAVGTRSRGTAHGETLRRRDDGEVPPLMPVVDMLNRKYGRDIVRLAVANPKGRAEVSALHYEAIGRAATEMTTVLLGRRWARAEGR